MGRRDELHGIGMGWDGMGLGEFLWKFTPKQRGGPFQPMLFSKETGTESERVVQLAMLEGWCKLQWNLPVRKGLLVHRKQIRKQFGMVDGLLLSLPFFDFFLFFFFSFFTHC